MPRQKNFFNITSSLNTADKNYGTVTIAAGKQTVLIGTIMASGENVKSLNIKINDAPSYKLAPSQNGAVLNYVGSALNIVLQPGDKAVIDFTASSLKGASPRQIYVAGEKLN